MHTGFCVHIHADFSQSSAYIVCYLVYLNLPDVSQFLLCQSEVATLQPGKKSKSMVRKKANKIFDILRRTECLDKEVSLS